MANIIRRSSQNHRDETLADHAFGTKLSQRRQLAITVSGSNRQLKGQQAELVSDEYLWRVGCFCACQLGAIAA